jgi:hypothetical protein
MFPNYLLMQYASDSAILNSFVDDRFYNGSYSLYRSDPSEYVIKSISEAIIFRVLAFACTVEFLIDILPVNKANL